MMTVVCAIVMFKNPSSSTLWYDSSQCSRTLFKTSSILSMKVTHGDQIVSLSWLTQKKVVASDQSQLQVTWRCDYRSKQLREQQVQLEQLKGHRCTEDAKAFEIDRRKNGIWIHHRQLYQHTHVHQAQIAESPKRKPIPPCIAICQHAQSSELFQKNKIKKLIPQRNLANCQSTEWCQN